MAAKWEKNQTTAAKRRCDLIIQNSGGDPAPPGTDFIAAGAVFVSGATAPKCATALGTLTNKRRPIVLADDTIEAVDTVAATATLTGHVYQTGDGPFTANEAYGTLTAGTDFWLIKVDANKVAVASSLANAYANTRVIPLGTEADAIISDKTTTERGLWGLFTYEATQAETDHDNPETAIIVDGTVSGVSYLRMNGGGAYTTNIMESGAANVLEQVLESGHTVADALRASLRTHAANFTREAVAGGGTKITFRNVADTKNSHHGTLTDAGRIDSGIDDLT